MPHARPPGHAKAAPAPPVGVAATATTRARQSRPPRRPPRTDARAVARHTQPLPLLRVPTATSATLVAPGRRRAGGMDPPPPPPNAAHPSPPWRHRHASRRHRRRGAAASYKARKSAGWAYKRSAVANRPPRTASSAGAIGSPQKGVQEWRPPPGTARAWGKGGLVRPNAASGGPHQRPPPAYEAGGTRGGVTVDPGEPPAYLPAGVGGVQGGG
ncbi:hypothetical protein BU14_0337s0004 [Porphyra umbilicalis]|uniref:Uncharacterized protein n=1 Tax=Porphyra umbilicalis TaxID=2786 RepID=A0A1X6NY64_PORUM|nr:hypothetical protein BU14_0337s0004 [Porphyra umbilicalis]|eukprot:OSX73569.1 hypothetical protein BU14_0337s0004 [Porphyra umbilicalis]